MITIWFKTFLIFRYFLINFHFIFLLPQFNFISDKEKWEKISFVSKKLFYLCIKIFISYFHSQFRTRRFKRKRSQIKCKVWRQKINYAGLLCIQSNLVPPLSSLVSLPIKYRIQIRPLCYPSQTHQNCLIITFSPIPAMNRP